MANVKFTDLTPAVSLDGTELLAGVQPGNSSGTSVSMTTQQVADLATQGALDASYIVVTATSDLANERTLAVSAALTLQDNGPGQPITVGTAAITGDVSIGANGTTSTLGNTAVTPGSYTNASLTVNAQGRITAASNGTAPVTSIVAGTGIDVSGSGAVTVSLQTPVTVTHGGTGEASLTAHAVLVGNGTSAVATIPAVAAGYVLASQGASSDPAFTADPVLGVAGSVGGSLTLAGESSGTVIIEPASAAGNWTLTLPGNDGISGQVLTTDGSGTSSWTFVPGTGTVTSIDVSGGTTGLTTAGGPVTGAGTITLDGVLVGANGGTGVANTGKTITLGGNLVTSGASSLTLTTTGPTNVTLPTAGTLATTTDPVTLAVASTPITGGTTTRVLYDNGGVLGEYAITGTGSVVLGSSNPTITLGNGTGLPISTGLSGAGTGVLTALGVNVGTAGAFVVNGGALGTPASGTASNLTGLPLTTGVTGVLPSANGGTGVNNGSATLTMGGSHTLSGAFTSTFTFTNNTSVTFPTSGTLATTTTPSATITVGTTAVAGGSTGRVLYDNAGTLGEMTTTGSGTVLALATSPSFTTPILGTPTSGTLTNCTGYTIANVSGLGTGVATALGVNTGSAGAIVLFNGALGTPSSGTLSSCTGLPISTGVSGLGANVATFLATPSSANLASAVTDETGSGALVFGTTPTIATPVLNGTPTGTGVATAATASTLALRDASANLTSNVFLSGYATTATAAGTTTLTVTSAQQQYFTGSTTQTVKLPVASTLSLGFAYTIVNNSTGAVTVQSSGSNTIYILAGSTEATFTCILTSGTTAASWDYKVIDNALASGKKLTVSNTLTFTGTDGSSVAFGTGGTVLYSGGALGTPSSGTLTNCTGLPVAGGGTGQSSFTAHGVLIGNGSSALAVTATGTAGFAFNSGGASADPTWGNNGIRAHINFNGTGTPAARGTPYNVTSITDNGVGDWTLNFTSALPSANYTAVSMCGDDGTNFNYMTISNTAAAPSASAIRVVSVHNSTVLSDTAYNSVACIGG